MTQQLQRHLLTFQQVETLLHTLNVEIGKDFGMKPSTAAIFVVVVIAGAVGYMLLFNGQTTVAESAEDNITTPSGIVQVSLPEQFSEWAATGKLAFEAKCATCHGLNAAGNEDAGPPLVHIIYEPNHHGDGAFLNAAMNGVRAHHWKFGDMPPVEGLTQGDIVGIVTYIRELQRANGIN